MADSPAWGRRRTLLISALVSALASFVLAATVNFPTFLVGNLLMGLGIGLYWPATESMVADLTEPSQRNEAYAITRLADSLGLSLGVVIGGAVIATTNAYRTLFVVDGCSFLIFCGIIFWTIAETLQDIGTRPSFLEGWGAVLRDRTLLIFAVGNSLFTIYIAQTQSTLPLYLSNIVRVGGTEVGFNSTTISGLFTWHIVLSVLLQLPLVRLLRSLSAPRVLMVSALAWVISFGLIWATGVSPVFSLLLAILALSVAAIAIITYTPAAASYVVELAPLPLRGVYISVNSLCWALGYFVGPTLGGFAMDQAAPFPTRYWLALAGSVGLALVLMLWLEARHHPPE